MATLTRLSEPQAVESHLNRWWHVVGGVTMNLALGSLYGWSVFVAPLEKEFHWKRADTSNVFIIAVVVFALSFIVAGRLQDKIGPFKISLTGALLVSLGFFLCSYADSITKFFVFFGVLGGLGNGFGYATPIPVMSKWFPDKRGLAVGLAVGGYGAGSAVFGPPGELSDSSLRLAHDVPGARRDFLCDDGLWRVPAEESAGGLPPRGMGAGSFEGCGQHLRLRSRGSVAYAIVLFVVGGICAGLRGWINGHQPAIALCQERGHSEHDAGFVRTGGRGRG